MRKVFAFGHCSDAAKKAAALEIVDVNSIHLHIVVGLGAPIGGDWDSTHPKTSSADRTGVVDIGSHSGVEGNDLSIIPGYEGEVLNLVAGCDMAQGAYFGL